MSFVLVLGGARSGKSDLAVQLAAESGRPVAVIATSEGGDDEMRERIRRHREARPTAWRTIEAPLDLLGAIKSAEPRAFLLVDCLTLWVSNLLANGAGAEEIESVADQAAIELETRPGVVVSNEVGLGIVPTNELARRFRDSLGAVNARFARAADRAVLMVAGRAVDLAPASPLQHR